MRQATKTSVKILRSVSHTNVSSGEGGISLSSWWVLPGVDGLCQETPGLLGLGEDEWGLGASCICEDSSTHIPLLRPRPLPHLASPTAPPS